MPRFLATTHDLPAGPPPEVLQQIDVAWERARELFESDLELHFEVDALLGPCGPSSGARTGRWSSASRRPRRWRSPAATRRVDLALAA